MTGGEKAVLDCGVGQEAQAFDQVCVGNSKIVILFAKRVEVLERFLEVGKAHCVAIVELLALQHEARFVEAVHGGDCVVGVIEGAIGRRNWEGIRIWREY